MSFNEKKFQNPVFNKILIDINCQYKSFYTIH